ncbi:MAG: hypothetical protein VX482_01585, partial [Candidatus Thermoplasmatota archaeon]|nr:hypothetical protein [Candidatus Thermoplasmatota archaeon]
MRLTSLSIICLMLAASFSGCLASDEVVDEGQYIDNEEDLIDYIAEGICGDIDGDGIPDCPLSGYIEGTDPWWCTSSGIGGHHVDAAYEGMEKGSLSDEICEELTYELKEAIEWAREWPTLGDAEAAGYTMTVGYVEGMGTHHVMLNDFSMEDSAFDAEDPLFPGTRIDSVFEFERPEFLMYAGEENDSELVGFAWFVHAPVDTPPEGFSGVNDWWHRHESLCFQPNIFFLVGADLSEEECENRAGENLNLE